MSQWPTGELVHTGLFRARLGRNAPATDRDRILLSYARARRIVEVYALTVEDITKPSQKFWDMHTDPIWTLDGAAGSLVTIQMNLSAGTLAMHVDKRPDVRKVLDDVLAFKVSGQFCLTEVGHGLDALHLETTATLLPDGSFELNTPNERAAKYMPPTTPVGLPCVAIVFARTIVGEEDFGIKPFLVQVNDGRIMAPGVMSKLLPQRGGSHPLNHSITYFRRVRLPAKALLGDLSKPKNPRLAFLSNIHRAAVGTLLMGSQGLSALQVATYIVAQYSNRRTVTNTEGGPQRIMEFRTQHIPIAHALAQAYVLKALHRVATTIFSHPGSPAAAKHGIAAILKVVTINHAQRSLLKLMERCGAQGLFEMNQLSCMHKTLQGASIAEGDSLVVSIRLASELLINRYAMIPSNDPDSLLARHETGVFESCRARLAQMPSHRSPDFNRFILPQAPRLVEALGHRIAYDAAVGLGVHQRLLDLYEVSCIKADAAWYVEHAGLSQDAQLAKESDAIEALLPHMNEFIRDMGVHVYAIAPIASQDNWDRLVASLETLDSQDESSARSRL